MQIESQTVEQILLVAKDMTAKVPNCWAVTADQRGGANARVVQPFFRNWLRTAGSCAS
jgi:hypothetical protein